MFAVVALRQCTANYLLFISSSRLPPSSEPEETAAGDMGRDVFNEKPSREEQMASAALTEKNLPDYAIMHTSYGDIHMKLFPAQVPWRSAACLARQAGRLAHTIHVSSSSSLVGFASFPSAPKVWRTL